MIEKLRQLLSVSTAEAEATSSATVQLATAALLVEVMVSDDTIEPAEEDALSAILEQLFTLSSAELAELFTEARNAQKDATCLYQFTRLINDHYRAAERFELVVNLWRIAYADGRLDKYEEGVIRHICELIHVPHSEFIRAKHQIKKA